VPTADSGLNSSGRERNVKLLSFHDGQYSITFEGYLTVRPLHEFMRSFSEILKTSIPGLKRRSPRVRRVPWILRQWPASKYPTVKWVYCFIGLIAYQILLCLAFFAILFIPLFLAHLTHPDRPFKTAPIHWLRDHFSHDVAFDIYVCVCSVIWFVLFYASMIFDYFGKAGAKQRHDDVA
jgi:hypothetical protein